MEEKEIRQTKAETRKPGDSALFREEAKELKAIDLLLEFCRSRGLLPPSRNSRRLRQAGKNLKERGGNGSL
jgi:hypothetical protein